jgi:hypothetical protein
MFFVAHRLTPSPSPSPRAAPKAVSVACPNLVIAWEGYTVLALGAKNR